MTSPGGGVIATVFVRVLPELGAFTTRLRADLRQAGRELRRVDREIAPVQRNLAFLARTATAIVPGIKLTQQSLLAIGSHAVVGGLVSAAGALSTMSGALLALPGAGVGAASVVGALGVGVFGVSDAMKQFFKNEDKFHDKVSKLSANAQATLNTINDLRGRILDFRNAVQDKLFAGMDVVVRQLADTFLPRLTTHFGNIANIVNGGAKDLATFVQTGETLRDVDEIAGNTETTFQSLRNAVIPGAQAFRDIAVVGSRVLPNVADEITRLVIKFKNFIEVARATGQLQMWIENGIGALKQLGTIAVNVGRILFTILGAAQASGNGLLDVLEEVTDKIADFLKTAEGQNALARFFENTRASAEAVIPVLVSFGDLFFNHIFPILSQFAQAVAPSVAKFFHTLGDALDVASPGIIAFANGFAAFVRGIIPALPAIGQLIGALGQLVGTVAAGLGPAFAQVAITIANALLPVINALTTVMQILPGGFFTFVTVIGVTIAVVNLLVGGLRTVISFATLFVTAFRTMITIVSSFQLAMAGVGSFMLGPWGIAIGAAVAALGILAMATNGASNQMTDFNIEIDRTTGKISGASVEALYQWAAGADTMTQNGSHLSDVLRDFGLTASDLTGYLLGNADATEKVNRALASHDSAAERASFEQFLDITKDKIKDQTNVQKEAIAAGQEYAGTQDTMAGSIAGVNGQLYGQISAVQQLINEQQAQQTQNLAALNAQLAWTQQLGRTNEVLAEGVKTLDAHTTEGAKNLESLAQLAAAGQRRVQQLQQENASTEQVNAALLENRNAILDLIQPFFSSREAAALFAEQIGLIPVAPQVKPTFNGAAALRAAQDLNGYIDFLTRERQINVRFNVNGNALAAAGIPTGGFQRPGLAAGGYMPAGQWTWVGEQGPELVRFGRGATVYSSDESQQMASNMGLLDTMTRGGSATTYSARPTSSSTSVTENIQVNPSVHVYIDGQEVRGMVRVELDRRDQQMRRLVVSNAGVRR